MTEKIIIELKQKAFAKGRRHFALREDGTVTADYRAGFRRSSFELDAALFEPTPIRDRHRAAVMLVAFVVLLLFDLGWFVLGFCEKQSDHRAGFFGAGFFFVIPMAICLWEYLKQSHNSVIFFSPTTGDSLVMIEAIPSRQDVDTFAKTLSETIFARREKHATPTPHDVVERLKELAQMREQSILSEQEFEKLKSQLLNTDGTGKPIGFGSANN